MYKVFVDHKPVIFIEKEEFTNNFPILRAKKIDSFEKQSRALLIDCSVDCPLQIVSADPEKTFNEVFETHIKIDAAGGLVKRKKEYLLIKRKGMWDIPKGKIDKGEKTKVAALREVEEECGIKGHEISNKLCVTYHTMKFKGRPALKRTVWYIMKYTGTKETLPERKEGITKAKWMSKEYMLAIRGRTYGSINEVLDQFVEQGKKVVTDQD
ncbi:MAG: NUDIX domain-containing protein [Crocinitomicaceae bacterium]|nr:NUDIX domain-containing protein [Crocinitomicaceae bacterium]MDG1659531.1 NUDIX domain-containing protein [Crocinitomicaceae bacterium]MDG2441253.1 NUDIX domain-containing protein [Crocinitomicaceae bacterium]